MTTCTWNHRSYLPHSWAISQMRCEKGNLWVRSSVLIWYWQISWRATICGQYLWGLFISPLFKNFVGSLPSYFRPSSRHPCLHHYLYQLPYQWWPRWSPTSSSLPASSLLLCSSSVEGRALCVCASAWCPFLCPTLSVTFLLAWLEWKSNQSEVVPGFSTGTNVFYHFKGDK